MNSFDVVYIFFFFWPMALTVIYSSLYYPAMTNSNSNISLTVTVSYKGSKVSRSIIRWFVVFHSVQRENREDNLTALFECDMSNGISDTAFRNYEKVTGLENDVKWLC